MFESLKNFLHAAIVKPFQQHISLGLIGLGIGAIFLSLLARPLAELLPFAVDSEAISSAFLTSGSAIIGAGVFSAVTKSALFSEIFQQHIFDVLHDPAHARGEDAVRNSWNKLTDALLRKTLPRHYRTATEQIQQHYLEADLQYHFENYEAKYKIEVDSASREVRVIQIMHARVVIRPGETNPIFTQELATRGQSALTSVKVNNQPVDPEAYTYGSVDDADKREFRLELADFMNNADDNGEVHVELERTYDNTQSLDEEPFLLGTTKRFVKGFSVKAKIDGGYRLFFTQTGLRDALSITNPEAHIDGEGYTCWTLARSDELMLPGHGFVLIFLPDSGSAGA